MKKNLLFLFLCFSPLTFAQDIETDNVIKVYETLNFENGQYQTIKDFDNKKPSNNLLLTVNSDDNLAYRFTTADGKKVNKPEVIVYEGIPYFRIKSVYNYFDKESRGQGYDGGNYYLKAKIINNRLTFRDYFSSNTAGLLGGLSGALAARRQKVLLYNQETSKIKIFKNYKNLREFVTNNYPSKISFVDIAEKDETLKDEADKVEFVLNNVL